MPLKPRHPYLILDLMDLLIDNLKVNQQEDPLLTIIDSLQDWYFEKFSSKRFVFSNIEVLNDAIESKASIISDSS